MKQLKAWIKRCKKAEVRGELDSNLSIAVREADTMIASLTEAVRILDFAFEDGMLSKETIHGLYVDPYGALNDMKRALGLVPQRGITYKGEKHE